MTAIRISRAGKASPGGICPGGVRTLLCVLGTVSGVLAGAALLWALLFCEISLGEGLTTGQLLTGEQGQEEARGQGEGQEGAGRGRCSLGLWDSDTGEISIDSVMKLSAIVFITGLVSAVFGLVVWYRCFRGDNQGSRGPAFCHPPTSADPSASTASSVTDSAPSDAGLKTKLLNV